MVYFAESNGRAEFCLTRMQNMKLERSNPAAASYKATVFKYILALSFLRVIRKHTNIRYSILMRNGLRTVAVSRIYLSSRSSNEHALRPVITSRHCHRSCACLPSTSMRVIIFVSIWAQLGENQFPNVNNATAQVISRVAVVRTYCALHRP